MPLLAQLEAIEWIKSVAQFGLAGGVLVWFMFRTEARLGAIERSCDRLAKAILIQVISDPGTRNSSKESARTLMTEIENEESK